MTKHWLLLIAVLLGFTAFSQNKGTITGIVTDNDTTHNPLPFVNIALKGTAFSTATDETGKYQLTIAPGNYTLQFSFVGYETTEQAITVVAGETLTINKTLRSASNTLKDVVIRQTANREKEAALLIEQKNAVEIRQSIGAQEMSRKGVSDVEEGLTKITGITKVGSRGLFVRGLEDRYNNLLINELAVPSNNPFRKIIPLDLFPTDIVSVIDVYKTFNPNLYGDFAGGTFNISTSKGGKSITRLSIGAGYTTQNNLADFSLSEDANTTKGFFGLTGKDRMLPGIFGSTPTNLTLSGQQSLNAFKSGFDVANTRSPLNTSIGLLHGEKFNLKNDARFSYLLSLNFDNNYKIRKGVNRTLEGSDTDITYGNNFFASDFKYETNTSALVGLNYKTSLLEMALTTFYLRTTVNTITDQFGVFGGNTGTTNYLLRTNQLDQSDYLTSQLTGKYFLAENKNQSIKGGVSFSKTSYQQPDRKFFGGTTEDNIGILTSYGGNNFLRQYLDIDGTYYFSGMAEYALKFGSKEEKQHQLTVGYNGNVSETTSSYRFVSTSSAGSFSVPINSPDNQIEADLAAETFNFRESSNAQYKVKLAENTNAGYANLLLHFADKWEINGGLRAEQASRETEYRENGSFTDPFKKITIDKLYVLPSLNVKYALSEKTNLRFATGITYTKPVLIEALPITYINADGTSVSGNPYLKNSDNFNADLKYELFPSNKEMFSVGVFGKKINDAIERSFQSSAGGFSTTFFNTGNATLYGAELEFIFDFARLSKNLSDFSLGFNSSLMHTNVKVNPTVTNSNGSTTESVETHTDRELQGASKWLVNSDLKYQFSWSKSWSNTISLVYSAFGKRIFSVGTKPFDHIYELPASKLDLVWASRLSEHFDLKFSADNILNPRIRFDLGDDNNSTFTEVSKTLQDYKKGIGFSMNLSYTF